MLYLTSRVYFDLTTRASERLLRIAPTSIQARLLDAEVSEIQGKFAIMNMNDRPLLWLNESQNENPSVLVKVIGVQSNRSAIGARVRVVTGNHVQTNQVHSGESVMSMNDLRLHFGLRLARKIDPLEVEWPTTGQVERFRNLDVNQIIYVQEGSGIIRTEKFAALRKRS